jgi:hypothetical protein
MRNADPIHLVEPGEFILGYPDNRGNMPPGPVLSALDDPGNQLPLVAGGSGFDRTVVENDRDLGFNGTFLVIRQLEQDVRGFWKYCQKEADRLAGRLGPPYLIDKNFIAAKLVGRWPDGSSLMRYQNARAHHAAGLDRAAAETGSDQAGDRAGGCVGKRRGHRGSLGLLPTVEAAHSNPERHLCVGKPKVCRQ